MNSSVAAILRLEHRQLLLLVPMAHYFLHKSEVFAQLLDRLDGRAQANPK
jgi:hypothetical protein